MTKFRYIDRGKNNLLVLIPGWASDHRIFTPLNLASNYLIPLQFSPLSFEQELLAVLEENNIKKISLFGWSLGGFVGAEFTAKYPGLIDETILVSIRKRYKREELSQIRKHIKKNKRTYLHKFYAQCFFNQKQRRWFKENLLKEYCEQLNLDYLLGALDYLEKTEIKPALLNKIKRIKIIHGEYDRIAPVQEAIDIKNRLIQAQFICIKDVGHIPFLKEDFARYI